MAKQICKTTMKKSALYPGVADELYNFLIKNVKWCDGIKSRHGFTRKAFSVQTGTGLYQNILPYVSACLKMVTKNDYYILGLYLNYYQNGEMYTPSHSHKGTDQLVISLGESRVLTVGKKNYTMNNGDAIIFGSSTHSVPKSDTKKGRISIATFMIRI